MKKEIEKLKLKISFLVHLQDETENSFNDNEIINEKEWIKNLYGKDYKYIKKLYDKLCEDLYILRVKYKIEKVLPGITRDKKLEELINEI